MTKEDYEHINNWIISAFTMGLLIGSLGMVVLGRVAGYWVWR